MAKGSRKKLDFEGVLSFVLFAVMNSRDYVTFVLGCLALALGIFFGFEDIQLGGFLKGFGTAALFFFVLKGLWLLVKLTKKESNIDR